MDDGSRVTIYNSANRRAGHPRQLRVPGRLEPTWPRSSGPADQPGGDRVDDCCSEQPPLGRWCSTASDPHRLRHRRRLRRRPVHHRRLPPRRLVHLRRRHLRRQRHLHRRRCVGHRLQRDRGVPLRDGAAASVATCGRPTTSSSRSGSPASPTRRAGDHHPRRLVFQDEPTNTVGDGNTCPDAAQDRRPVAWRGPSGPGRQRCPATAAPRRLHRTDAEATPPQLVTNACPRQSAARRRSGPAPWSARRAKG
jgi:hypothetical protein